MFRVFEAFSGVGSQRMALRNLKANFQVVATSDIDQSAIIAYYFIHEYNKENNNSHIDIEVVKDELLEKGILSKSEIIKKSDKELKKIYNASIFTKNLGDISKVDTKDIPDHDIFTYSFPCQDISSVGTRKGLDVGSGTRSSLLWECEKIISNKKPKYLLLENVKNLSTGKNKANFLKWIDYLESLGYENYWKIMDSKDYGIPQRRPRTIVVSKLGKSKTNLIKDNFFEEKTIEDIIDNNIDKWERFAPKSNVKITGDIKTGETKFLDDRDWKRNGIMIRELCSTQRAGRTGLKFIKKEGNVIYQRRISALESCRLMGFSDSDYKMMKKGDLSDSVIMKLCGNSIVVNVLENIFKNIIEEEKND